MPTPEELRTWREAAKASGNASDVAAIDAELAKVQPADDFSPLREAYADKQHAVANGAPPDVIAAIDAHIHDFTNRMKQEDVRRNVEGMGASGRFLAGAGAGLTNVWQHAKDVAHEVATAGGQETGWDAFRGNQAAGGLPVSAPTEGEAAYQQARQAQQQQLQQESAPLTGTLAGELGHLTGEAAGTAPIALATGGAGPVVGGALAGAGTGALLSEPGERLQGAGIGGLAGGATGAIGKLVSVPVKGVVKPSEAAQTLQDLGVPGITAGQAAPKSAIAHFEQAAESTPLGASVKAAREELPLNLEHRIIREAAPPGFEPTLGRDASVPERLEELRQAYGSAYDSLLDRDPVPKGAIQRDVLVANMGPSEGRITPQQRQMTDNFLKNQLAKLEDNNSLRTLHNIRSAVSERIRDVAESEPLLARHLGDIKSILTDHIEGALKASADPEAFSKLRALDAAYSRYKTVLGASAYDPAGATTITPDRLSRSILRGTTHDRFAQGAGGDLRELARAGKQVLSPPRPTTGALSLLTNAVPVLGPWAAGLSGYVSSHFPQAMMGQTLPQRILQRTLGQPVVSGALGQAARTGAADLLLGGEQEAPPDYQAAPLPDAKVLTQTLKRKKK
jgi:hypothetical protein